MSTKQLVVKARFHIQAGTASLKPPLGPFMSAHKKIKGIEVCKKFNDVTKHYKNGEVLPTDLYIYSNATFDLKVYKPTMTAMILKAMGIEKGSSNPGREEYKTITRAQVQQVATEKQSDLNADTIEGAIEIVAGTLRSMGIKVAN